MTRPLIVQSPSINFPVTRVYYQFQILYESLLNLWIKIGLGGKVSLKNILATGKKQEIPPKYISCFGWYKMRAVIKI